MELKARLLKPYSEEERLKFVVKYNHELGYKIESTDTSLDAYGYTEEEEIKLKRKRDLSILECEFQEKKQVILNKYLDALIHHDNLKLSSVEQEMQDLDKWYDNIRRDYNNG